jgi:hypothetical protein
VILPVGHLIDAWPTVAQASAQARWRAVNGPYLVPLVRAGAWFEGGRLVERGGAAC